MVAFFWTLVFGFVVGNDRTVQALLDRFVAHADDVDSLTYPSYSNLFTPELLEFLRDILADHVDALEPRHDQLAGRLARFRDVLIRDGTFVKLVQSAAEVYPATTEGDAGCKVHLTVSLERGVPTTVELTDGKTHDRKVLKSVDWVENALVLLDLGYYDFWLSTRSTRMTPGS